MHTAPAEISIATNLLSELTVLHPPNITTKRALFSTNSHLINRLYPKIPARIIAQALMQREDISSTGLGHGVAIPHARLQHLTQPIVGIIVLQAPILFDDDNPDVDIVCTICAPPDIKSEYNNLLAEIASNLQCPQQRQRLRSAATNRDLYNDFIQHR